MEIRAKFVRASAALGVPCARELLVENHANSASVRAARSRRDAGEHSVRQQRESPAARRAIVARHHERRSRRARAKGDRERLSAARAASRCERSHRVHEELSGRGRSRTAGLELHLAAGVLHGALRLEVRPPLGAREAAFLQPPRACRATSSARGPSQPSWRSRSSRAQTVLTGARTRRLRRRRRPPPAPRSMSARRRARLPVSLRQMPRSQRPRRRPRLRWRAPVPKVSREAA